MCLNLNKDMLWDKWNRPQHMKQFSLESYPVTPEVKWLKEEFELREYAIVSITRALGTERKQHRKWSRARKGEKMFKKLGVQTESRSFENVQEPDLGKLDTTWRQKAHQSSLKKVVTIIWTALQYDVNGLLRCLALNAVPLKHCLDLHFTVVTMQQAHEASPQGCSLYRSLRSDPGNDRPALHPHCNIQARSEPPCLNPCRIQLFASWFQEIKLPSSLIPRMGTNLWSSPLWAHLFCQNLQLWDWLFLTFPS